LPDLERKEGERTEREAVTTQNFPGNKNHNHKFFLKKIITNV
jgi:hypothetical protein